MTKIVAAAAAVAVFQTCMWEMPGFNLLGFFGDFPQCLQANASTVSTKGLYHFLPNLCLPAIHDYVHIYCDATEPLSLKHDL
jgi:hypothetical protein